MINLLCSYIVSGKIYKTLDIYAILWQAGFDVSKVQYHRVINELIECEYLTRIHRGVYIKNEMHFR
mgnify:CR=1 FL=1